MVKTTSGQDGGIHPLDTMIGLCQSPARGWWSKPIGEASVAPHAPGGDMKVRFLVAAVLAAMLAIAATTASGGAFEAPARQLRGWLPNEAPNRLAWAGGPPPQELQGPQPGP